MTKIVLGPTKGSVDGNQFGIVDNVLEIVYNYERDLLDVSNEKKQKIKQIEEEAKKKIESLKSDLMKNLGAFYEVKE
jgi:hypothetical protein